MLKQKKDNVPLAFEFTIRGDGDLARAFREGDKDWDRWYASLGVGDGERARLQQDMHFFLKKKGAAVYHYGY